MRKIAQLLLLIPLVLAGCVSAPKMPPKESSGFRAVPSELTGVDWKRAPNDVLRSPAKDEPLEKSIGDVVKLIKYLDNSDLV